MKTPLAQYESVSMVLAMFEVASFAFDASSLYHGSSGSNEHLYVSVLGAVEFNLT